MSGELFFEGAGFAISRIVAPPLDNNVYLIECTETGASLVVDAASDEEGIIALVGTTDVEGVVTTHGHWDHHGAIPALTHSLGIPFMLHPNDADLAGKQPDVPLTEGEISLGATKVEIRHTPGHTTGSVCLVLDGVVITGDTLFPGGPGATRFDHSSFDTIIESIESKLFTLPDDTVVLPGHGASTTIGTERPRLPAWIERGW
jgi:glyoxylase-like metal-dependent hydrolase (beta-lactamase superfamily II)